MSRDTRIDKQMSSQLSTRSYHNSSLTSLSHGCPIHVVQIKSNLVECTTYLFIHKGQMHNRGDHTHTFRYF